jgi:hypothetical protein
MRWRSATSDRSRFARRAAERVAFTRPFAPPSDHRAVGLLREYIFDLSRSSESLRISSALYLFKDDRWTVFQAPVGAQ